MKEQKKVRYVVVVVLSRRRVLRYTVTEVRVHTHILEEDQALSESYSIPHRKVGRDVGVRKDFDIVWMRLH
jgi:hypothetical protein